MKDFVSLNINKDVKYPISDYLFYCPLSRPYEVFVAATFLLIEPTIYAEAIKNPR